MVLPLRSFVISLFATDDRLENFLVYVMLMIQPFFDYACNAWYSNLNKKLKMCLQAAQNKCIRFCLKLNDRSSIKSEDFEKINWLLIHERVHNVLYAVYTNFLLRIVLTILMRYMFL